MGIHEIKMPDIGEGIAEVELAAWHVAVGEAVAENQPLADVMTDKATVEIPSPVTGTVLALGGKVGEVMAVGAMLIRLEVAGTGNTAEGRADAVEQRENGAPARPAHEAPLAPVPEAPPPQPGPAAAETTCPASRTGAAETGAVQAMPPVPSALPARTRAFGDKPLASPAVRKRAWDLGIDLRLVQGRGDGGRILHEDLAAYVARAAAPDAAAPTDDTRYAARQGETRIEVVGLRRRIAQKMQEAKRRIPHFSYVEEIDVTELEALRARLNDQWGAARGKLTLLPLLARAVVLALRDHPQMNARFDDEAGVVTRFAAAHIGIATQTPQGLMVPVLRHAESRDPWGNAAEIARVAQAARDGKAARDELSGSTITISSLGPLGGIVSTPVINHPEVAIIGVNRIVERPVFVAGQVAARKLMNLSSSFDHRVVDGMDAAEFIQAIRALLETPAMLFID